MSSLWIFMLSLLNIMEGEKVASEPSGFLTSLGNSLIYSARGSIDWENIVRAAMQLAHHLISTCWSVRSLVTIQHLRFSSEHVRGYSSRGHQKQVCSLPHGAWAKGGHKITTDTNVKFKIRIMAMNNVILELKSERHKWEEASCISGKGPKTGENIQL